MTNTARRLGALVLFAAASCLAWIAPQTEAGLRMVSKKASAQEKPLRFTVVDFELRGGEPKLQAIRRSLAETISMGLVGDERITLVERAELWRHALKVIGLENLQRNPDLVTDAHVLNEARIDLVLRGSFLEYRGKLRIDAVLEDRRSGVTRELMSETADVREIYDALKRVAQDLSAHITALGASMKKRVAVACFEEKGAAVARASASRLAEHFSLAVMSEVDRLLDMALVQRPSAPSPCDASVADRDFARSLGADAVIGGTLEAAGRQLRVTPRVYIRERDFTAELPAVTGPRDDLLEIVLNVAEDLGNVFDATLVRDRWDLTALQFKASSADGYLREAEKHLRPPENLGLAALMATRALGVRADDPDALLLLSGVRRRQERTDEAAVLVQKALEARPGNRAVLLEQAAVSKERGDYVTAIAALNEALAILDSADARLELVETYLLTRKTELADVHVKRVIKLEPKKAAAHVLQARIHQASGKLDEGIAALQQARLLGAADRTVDPILWDLHVARARQSRDTGDKQAAIAHYRAANAIRNDIEIYAWLAYLYNELDDYAAVIAVVEEAKKHKLSSATLYNNLGFALFKQQRNEEALKAYNEAAQLEPRAAIILASRIQVMIIMRRYPEALQAAEDALAILPKEPQLHAARGEALLQLRRIEDALKEFAHAEELDPKSASVLSRRALAYTDLGRFEEGLHLFEKLIQLHPNFRGGYSNKAYTLNQLGRFDEAIRTADLAIGKFPGYANPFNHKGFAQYRLGQREAGRNNILKAAEMDAGYAGPLFSLARIYALENDQGLALGHLRRAVSIDGTFALRAESTPEFAVWKNDKEFLEIIALPPGK